jgi:uncharacterized protein (DUF1778 family)
VEIIMTAKTNFRSSRLSLRVTHDQKITISCAVEVAHKLLNDFVLEAACRAAVDTLLDQQSFMVSGSQYRSYVQLLERPEANNP